MHAVKNYPSSQIESLRESGTRWKIQLARWNERRATLIAEDGARQNTHQTSVVDRTTCLERCHQALSDAEMCPLHHAIIQLK